MTASGSSLYLAKRKLLLRDSLAFFVLLAATLILYAATSFLFRSFSERRDDIARTYATRGRAALAAGHPDQAIAALRTALSYAPDDRASHLLLAQALADAKHTEEATNYFLSLRETQPGDGFINLELARLARQKGDKSQALDYYRAASLGNWQGDSLAQRRGVELELAGYLVQNGDLPAARAEILLAAANSPETAQLDIIFGEQLQQAADPSDALTYYRKATQLQGDTAAYEKLGRLLYATGNYAAARDALERALRQEHKAPRDSADVEPLRAQVSDAERMLQLSFSADLPAQVLADHIHTDALVARQRLTTCSAAAYANGAGPAPFQALTTRWQSAAKVVGEPAALKDPANQATMEQLIFDTELETARLCSPPTGDDARLLLLAHAHETQ